MVTAKWSCMGHVIKKFDLTSAKHRLRLVRFHLENKDYNAYQLGYLTSIPLNSRQLFAWGAFRDEKLVGVLMRYTHRWFIDDRPGCETDKFVNIINQSELPHILIHDNPKNIDSFYSYLTEWTVSPMGIQECEFAKFNPERFVPHKNPELNIRKATLEDLNLLVKFHQDAEMFTRNDAQLALMITIGRIVLLEQNGEVVCTMGSQVESPYTSMIDLAFTPATLRNQGLFRYVASEFLSGLLSENKSIVCYYNNPATGKTCARYGFDVVGKWRWASFSATPKKS